MKTIKKIYYAKNKLYFSFPFCLYIIPCFFNFSYLKKE